MKSYEFQVSICSEAGGGGVTVFVKAASSVEALRKTILELVEVEKRWPDRLPTSLRIHVELFK